MAIEYRWAENQFDRLPALAAELVRRQVAVIVATGGRRCRRSRPRRQPRRSPSSSSSRDDPVRLGLVASLARPGGNLTGINFLSGELLAKRLELLRELVPAATRVAVLVNPANATASKPTLRDVEAAAAHIGTANPGSQRQHQPRDRCGLRNVSRRSGPTPSSSAMTPSSTAGVSNWSLWRMRHGFPATYSGREFAEVGGLMSYGTNITDAYRQVGVYAGRILKGAKPADLPVVQSTKFELVINAADRQNARPHCAADAARTRRRGDRVSKPCASFAALHELGFGTNLPIRNVRSPVANGGKADNICLF